jgi:hypothetical protein
MLLACLKAKAGGSLSPEEPFNGNLPTGKENL